MVALSWCTEYRPIAKWHQLPLMAEISIKLSTDTTAMHSQVRRKCILWLQVDLISLSDADKQMAINVFLGVFQPQEGDQNIWDLPTDYYLHHTNARELPETRFVPRHTKWWDDEIIQSLPLPLYHSRGEPESKSAASAYESKTLYPVDSFDEVYKPLELTDFDALFARNLTRTPE